MGGFRFRLLPLTMFAVFMLLAIKLADVVRGGEEFSRALLIGNSIAASTPEKPAESAVPEKAAEPNAAEGEMPAISPPEIAPPSVTAENPTEEVKSAEEKPAEETKPAEEARAVEEKPAEVKEGEKSADAEKPSAEGMEQSASSGSGGGEHDSVIKQESVDESKGKVVEKPQVEVGGGTGLSPGSRYFSPIELELLNQLAKRREQLDAWEKEVLVKENVLANSEKRIEEKLLQIDALKQELGTLLTQYNDQEDAKIKSLVKIYENMKPRDAARIFDEVEMPILLLVIDRMAEKKAAPILANMDSKKAKQLTVELADQRRMQQDTLGRGAVGKVPPKPAVPAAAPPAPANR